MKKRLLIAVLGLVVVIAAAAAAAPMVIGRSVREATMTSMLNLLPPESRSQFQITETRFDTGWFSSEGELDVRSVLLAEQEDLAIRLQFDIAHGPLLFTPDGPRLGLAYAEIIPSLNSPELTQAVAELGVALPEVRIDMIADLDQTLHLGLAVDPLNVSDESGQLSFAGITGSLRANPDMSAELRFSMGPLQAVDADSQASLSLAGVEVTSNTRRMNDMLAPSMAMLMIPSISSTAPYPFTLDNVSADSRLQASAAGAQQIDIHQGFHIASIDAEVPVQSVALTMDINELHSELIRSYYRMITELQNALNGNTSIGVNQMQGYGQDMAMLAVQNSLVFNTLIEANAFDGDHSVSLNIDWRGLPDVSELDSIEALQILEVFGFDVSLSLDEAAVMRSPLAEMVDPTVQQGYLRVEGGRLLMDMNLSDAALTVNGKTVALEQFL
jgi:hypothetical protein